MSEKDPNSPPPINPWRQETFNRKRLALSRRYYGISYLDDALLGIKANDLVVIGAETGVGKTQICTAIAAFNALQQINVTYYALEAADYEIHTRIKYQRIAENFFTFRGDFPDYLRLNFKEWECGKFDEFLDKLDEKVSKELEVEYSSLRIHTPNISNFTTKNFADIYEQEESDKCALFILDHLHYLWWGNENEYQAIRNAIAKIRDLVNQTELPLILVSHLRKEERGNQSIIPTYHELHGSSEIAKRASAVITFAPAYQITRDDGQTFDCAPGSTFVRVGKARSASTSVTRYAALLEYDLSSNKYKNGYVPFYCDRMATTLKELPKSNWERWMKNAKELGQ